MERVKTESSDRAEIPGVDSRVTSPGEDRGGATWKDALMSEIRSHPFGYGVLAVAMVTGPFLIMMIFPEVSPFQALVGGLAFGVYAALCAVPQKFM